MKFKKILLSAISTAAIMSAMLVPTLAQAATQPALIDTTKTGTLTVHKYEMTDTSSVDTGDHKGTGEASDESKVDTAVYPENGAVKFPEVTFRATRVANLDSTYYTPEGVSLPTPAQAATMAPINTFTVMTDDADGVARFTNLPLGIYLVQEIDSPPQVTEKTADFVVSVPMTAEDGIHWNYDPVVFPKNKTAYTDITIKKIDRRHTSTVLENAKFTLQRLHDYGKKTNAWDTIETNITTDETGIASPSRPLAYNSTYRLVETQAPEKFILDHAQDTTSFYIDSQGKICNNKADKTVLDAANPTQITISNTKPEISMFIDKNRGNGNTPNLVDETTVSHKAADDYECYVIRVTTPDVDMKSLSKFVVTQNFGNKSLTKPIVEKIVESGTNNALPVNASGYTPTVDTTAPYTVRVDFSTANTTTVKGDTVYDIYIKSFTHNYTATTTHESDVEYTVETGTTKTDALTSNEVTIRTAAYQFKKYGKTATETKPLKDACFKLYKTENDAINNTNPVTAKDATTGQYATTFKSDDNGMVLIEYLDYGDDIENGSQDYWIVETSAPNGYNLLKTPQKITVNKNSYSYSNTQLTITDTAKSILPRTGGYGVIAYGTIGAGIAAAGALIILSTFKKRKKTTK